jgi:hypothetical protein
MSGRFQSLRLHLESRQRHDEGCKILTMEKNENRQRTCSRGPSRDIDLFKDNVKDECKSISEGSNVSKQAILVRRGTRTLLRRSDTSKTVLKVNVLGGASS